MPAINKIASLKAKLKAASSIVAEISHVNIYAFGLDDLAKIRGKLGPICRGLVNGNVPSNAFQVTQALQATVEEKVQLAANANATARAQLVHQLAHFGFTISGGQTAEVKGKALIFGVKLKRITKQIRSVTGTPVASRSSKHLRTRNVFARSHTL